MYLNRKKLIFLSVSSGFLLGIAFGNKYAFPLTFIGFVPLLYLEHYFFQKKDIFKENIVFSYFYLSFIIFNLTSAWWTYYSSIAGFFAVISLNSLYMAFAFWLYHIFKKHLPEYLHFIAFISFWISAEFIHFNWELSWPWLTLGIGLANQIKLIQWYEYTGVLGGSLWILSCNYVIFILLINIKFSRQLLVLNILKTLFLLIIVFIPVTVSNFLYYNFDENCKLVKIVIIQPNYSSYNEKYTIEVNEQLDRILKLTETEIDSSVDYVIAPETALPDLSNQDSLLNNLHIHRIKALLQKYPSTKFIIGLSSFKIVNEQVDNDQYTKQFQNGTNYKAYNTAIQIDTSCKIQMHHKTKLVLGTEKMPFGSTIKFLERLTVDLGGVAGSIVPDNTTYPFYNSALNISVAPLICFESVYGEYVTEFVKNKANLIFIITNDDWWKNSPGYKQHFMNAKLRAIENRKCIARSANTGISGFINTKGEIKKKVNGKKLLLLAVS